MLTAGFLTKALVGCFTLCVGLTLLLSKSWILEFTAASILVLKPNALIKNLWLKPPEKILTNIYIFNWSNPESFRNTITKPKVQEIGPYRYFYTSEKRNVVWNDNNTVTCTQVRYWTFDKERTKQSLSDNITVMHSIAFSAAHYFRYWNYFFKKSLSLFLAANSYDLQHTKTANEFLNSGVEDPFFDAFRYLPFIASDIPRFKKFAFINF
ncbi:hypothetical protein ILUMI_06170, partial [Ignelater luminosus]